MIILWTIFDNFFTGLSWTFLQLKSTWVLINFLPFIKFVSSNCNIFDNAPDSGFKIYPKNWDTKLTAAFISANMD